MIALVAMGGALIGGGVARAHIGDLMSWWSIIFGCGLTAVASWIEGGK